MKIMQLLLERKFILIAVTWTVLITFLSLISINNTSLFMSKLPYKDKIVHFVFYFMFVVLWNFSLNQKIPYLKYKILAGAILYGIIIEVLQGTITISRTADFFDVIANSLGALIAFFMLPYFVRLFYSTKIKN